MKTAVVILGVLCSLCSMAQTNTAVPDTTDRQALLDEKKREKEEKQLKKLKVKHQDWNHCFIVTVKGDTIRGRIKSTADFTASGTIFTGDFVVLAYPDEREEKIDPSIMKELYIPEERPEYHKYISILRDSTYINANKELFRVIVDGKCKLVFDDVTSSSLPVVDQSGMVVGAPSSSDGDRYYIYYKNILMPVRTEALFAISTAFRKKSREIFYECPALVEKIEDKSYRSADLREIVKEFNLCIESK